jgi:Ser/Thr protein kinase RdoA (MazF antagonist)
LAFEIESPEGKRLAALFIYADGKGLSQEISLEESKNLGTVIAKMHETIQGFETSYQRIELNLDYLLDQSIMLIKIK